MCNVYKGKKKIHQYKGGCLLAKHYTISTFALKHWTADRIPRKGWIGQYWSDQIGVTGLTCLSNEKLLSEHCLPWENLRLSIIYIFFYLLLSVAAGAQRSCCYRNMIRRAAGQATSAFFQKAIMEVVVAQTTYYHVFLHESSHPLITCYLNSPQNI